VHEGIDVLAPENEDILNKLELDACEEALTQKIIENNHIRFVYENSTRYKVGRFLLAPLTFFKK
jgi:hypothetical protein